MQARQVAVADVGAGAAVEVQVHETRDHVTAGRVDHVALHTRGLPDEQAPVRVHVALDEPFAVEHASVDDAHCRSFLFFAHSAMSRGGKEGPPPSEQRSFDILWVLAPILWREGFS